MMRKLYVVSLLLFCLVLQFNSIAFASSYSQIISFGDSLSDNGDADNYGFGVASNGDVWLDHLAGILGVELLDMAYGGARTYGHPSSAVSPATTGYQFGFGWQIEQYLATFTVDPDALYTIWIGGNDLLNLEGASPEAVIGNAVTIISQGINDLVTAGVQNILVINMPNLGLTPLMNGQNTEEPFNLFNDPVGGTQLSEAFNAALDAAISPYGSTINLTKLDIFTLMADFISEGLFDNTTNMLQFAGETSDSYLFFDAIHPTTLGHSSVADEAASSVRPVPALTFPSETIENSTPTYTWNSDPKATWYKLFVGDSSEEKIYAQWYEASEICSDGSCTVTVESELLNDNYEWWVKSWNDYGSIWSDGMTFTVQAGGTPPSKVILASPSETTQDATPTFTWVADPVSTYYKLWVGFPNGDKAFAQWYDAAEICSGGNCSVTFETELLDDDYEWYVKSWNESGKVWSDGMAFTVSEIGLDECGVLAGDGSTCAGCDGVANSGIEFDECGVCGGDGSTCETTSLGLFCSNDCDGSFCSNWSSNSPCVDSDLSSSCLGTSTGMYCSQSCSSDADCENPNRDMKCLTSCPDYPDQAGKCWSVSDYTFMTNSICPE